jgi:hypothetical protein
MKNQIAESRMIQPYPRPRAFAFALVILAGMLLASGWGSVLAASGKSVDAQDCGSQPICGYLQAHSGEVATMTCDDQPICNYLKAHNSMIYTVANASLPAVLMAQPRPGTYDVQLQVVESTLVRSGPGENFYSYGELPAAFVSRVIGINQLGNWWVIPLPFSAAPDGMGWVDGASVSAGNVSMAPIDPPACQGLAYCDYLQAHSQPDVHYGVIDCYEQPICGYLQAHNRQNLSVFQPSFATEQLFGHPKIAVTGICRPTVLNDC